MEVPTREDEMEAQHHKEALMLKTVGTVSTYKGMFKCYSLIENTMVGTSTTGRPLVVRLRGQDFNQ
jgi:hypothetical protein